MTEKPLIAVRKQSLELLFQIVVQPRASKTMIAGRLGEALKLRLTAPPVEGAANTMCLKFLSKWLNVPRSALAIAAGATSRHKTICLRCSDQETLAKEHERLNRLFTDCSLKPG